MARSPIVTVALVAMIVFLAVQARRDSRTRLENERMRQELAEVRAQLRDAPNGPKPPDPIDEEASRARPEVPPPSGAGNSEGTGVYKRVSPSVVAVANNALVRRGYFNVRLVEVPQGTGTGFVWDKQGHIVSNYHVVHQANTLTVTFPDGTQYPADLVWVAPDYDLAVLKVDAPAEKLRPVATADSRRLQVGQPVYAIGNPFGLDTTLSAGIVSALGRTITSMTERKIKDVIQTDAAINPGNSGGPLLDAAGNLVGVNTAIISPSGAYAGIGFAVPSATVSRVVPQLIEKGHVTRAGLGVELLPDHITERSGLEGVAIYAVPEESQAERAGLEGLAVNRYGQFLFGDIIVGIDGKPVRTVEDLQSLLDARRPGDAVRLKVRRGGKEREVPLRLMEE